MRFTKSEVEIFGDVTPVIMLWYIVKNQDGFERDDRDRIVLPEDFLIDKVGINSTTQGFAIRKLIYHGYLTEHSEYRKRAQVDGQSWERQVGHLFKLTDKWRGLPAFKDLRKNF